MYIWWLLLYGFIYSVSGTLARRLDQPYILFALFISVYWVILLHFLFRRKRCRIYGICLPEEDAACGKLILAALSFAAANLMLYGCSGQWSVGWHSLPLTTLAGECVLTVMAVWGEEVFFRGVLPEKLSEHLGRTAAGWISVLLFAVLHFVNLWQLGSVCYVLVQTLCAAALGMILLRLRQQSGSLIPGTAVHALINLTAVPAELLFPAGRNDLTGKKALLYLASAVICVIVCASEERRRAGMRKPETEKAEKRDVTERKK